MGFKGSQGANSAGFLTNLAFLGERNENSMAWRGYAVYRWQNVREVFLEHKAKKEGSLGQERKETKGETEDKVPDGRGRTYDKSRGVAG